jgi:hypothetical protein
MMTASQEAYAEGFCSFESGRTIDANPNRGTGLSLEEAWDQEWSDARDEMYIAAQAGLKAKGSGRK